MCLKFNPNRYSILWTLALIFFAHCATSKSGTALEPKIIEVTSQKYSGGVKGTPSGIKYKIYIVSPGNQTDFQSLGFWVDEKYASAKAYKKRSGGSRFVYEKGDTLEIAANFIKSAQGYVFQDDQINKAKPANMPQKIVLEYTCKNQNKYTGFEQIKVLEEELRP